MSLHDPCYVVSDESAQECLLYRPDALCINNRHDLPEHQWFFATQVPGTSDHKDDGATFVYWFRYTNTPANRSLSTGTIRLGWFCNLHDLCMWHTQNGPVPLCVWGRLIWYIIPEGRTRVHKSASLLLLSFFKLKYLNQIHWLGCCMWQSYILALFSVHMFIITVQPIPVQHWFVLQTV